MDRFEEIEASMGQLIDVADMFSEWRRKLLLNDEKKPRAIITNVLIALREAPEWKGVVKYDEFSHVTSCFLPPPWVKDRSRWEPQPWSDYDDVACTEWMQREGILVKPDVVAQGVMTVAKEQKFHPVRDYLHGLTWDGIERLESTMVAALGTENTAYTRAAFRCFMIAAVARVMKPGCKADNVLILEGAQGARKSTACNVLFGRFFTDDMADLGSKDAAMQARGVWCIELAELSSMGKAQIEQVKAFITRRVDRFRPSYGRHVIEAPRECVFIGTTNADHYLKDETGARRFWPLKCGVIDIPLIQRWRDQLWAEARALYDAGEPHWFTEDAVIEEAREQQDRRYQDDPWAAIIQAHIASKSSTTVEELLSNALEVEKARQRTSDQMRVSSILKKLGWGKERASRGGIRVYVYTPPSDPLPNLLPNL